MDKPLKLPSGELARFLDTDIFHVSVDDWVSFLDPLIESWDIDLATFALEIVLNEPHSVEEPGA